MGCGTNRGQDIEMMPPLFTILTPTYNRAYALPALKASLDAQTESNFEWLIVDDGSSDGTADLVGKWIETSAYPVKLIRSPNGGKHRALNKGIPEAKGDWIYIVDSDDVLPLDALEKIAPRTNIAKADPAIGGIMGYRQTKTGEIIGKAFPEGLRRRDAATLTFEDKIRGDKAEVFKASVLRKFPFPEIPGEKFITECVVWFRIAQAGYDLLLMPEAIYTCDYREDGLSARSFELRLRNPRGTLLFYAEELALPYSLSSLFREAVNYVRFRLLSLGKNYPPPGLGARAKRIVALAAPMGLAVSVYDRMKFRKAFR